MMKNSEIVSCISPNIYLRLADMGWRDFDMSMMTNNQQMQSVTNSMMNNPNIGKLWHDIVRDNHQNTVEQMTSSMKQNSQKMQPMMNDLELRQQMTDNMMNNPQFMNSLMQNH
jgi:hypothetical protein